MSRWRKLGKVPTLRQRLAYVGQLERGQQPIMYQRGDHNNGDSGVLCWCSTWTRASCPPPPAGSGQRYIQGRWWSCYMHGHAVTPSYTHCLSVTNYYYWQFGRYYRATRALEYHTASPSIACCFNGIPAALNADALCAFLVRFFLFVSQIQIKSHLLPMKHDALIQCCFNAGPA